MNGRLSRALHHLAHTHGGDWVAHSMETLREGRALAVVARRDAPVDEWIMKFYSDPVSARRAASRLSEVSRLLREPPRWPELRVPDLVSWDPETATVVQTKARGVRLADLPDQMLIERVEHAGHALAELHTLSHGTLPVTGLEAHLHELIRPSFEVFQRELPHYAELIEHGIGWMRRFDHHHPSPDAPRVIHRDYQLRQLLDDGTILTIVDWDDASAGDAAFDVGYMIAYLRSHFDAAVATVAQQRFLAGYRSVRSVDVATRVPLWLAFNHLRRAARRFRLRDEGWAQTLEVSMRRLSTATDFAD